MATFKEAIATILDTDARSLAAGALGTLCGYDATSKPDIVFYANPPKEPDVPLLTYSISAEAGDLPRNIYLDITAWGGDLKAIHDRVYALLHERRQVEVTDWQVKGLFFESAGPELWDPALKCYFQRARYRGVCCKV